MERKKRNHNEGSIRERADGRFEIRVTAGYDFEIGKPKRISYYAKTKAEAIQKRSTRFTFRNTLTRLPPPFSTGCGSGWKPT